jgi:hypothetical protein
MLTPASQACVRQLRLLFVADVIPTELQTRNDVQTLDLKRLKKAGEKTPWDFGNKVLYELCEVHPAHTNEDEIIAKVWLVGRSYSAAIERRKDSREVGGESFYTQIVGPKMRQARVDEWLSPLSDYIRPTLDNCAEIIDAHKRLTDLFHEITGLEKRSLASKYLHFHFRNLFYIYDARASQNLAKITPRLKVMPALGNYDQVYATHFMRSLNLVDLIEREHGIYLNPRKLDDYLLGLI